MIAIKFKSEPENYRKEYLGLKNNTIRRFKGDDERQLRLVQWLDKVINNLSITIVNSKTKEEFTREIRDVSYYDVWYIITWKE